MEILSFIFGVVITFFALGIVTHCKDTQPKNNVHFYVARDKFGTLCLYISKPFRGNIQFCSNIRNGALILVSSNFKSLGLNEKDFQNLKWEDEPVEVFLNLED